MVVKLCERVGVSFSVQTHINFTYFDNFYIFVLSISSRLFTLFEPRSAAHDFRQAALGEVRFSA